MLDYDVFVNVPKLNAQRPDAAHERLYRFRIWTSGCGRDRQRSIAASCYPQHHRRLHRRGAGSRRARIGPAAAALRATATYRTAKKERRRLWAFGHAGLGLCLAFVFTSADDASRLSAASADVRVTPGAGRRPSDAHHPGFEWLIDGDANRNASVEVSYRKQGETPWKRGLPLLRLQGERIFQPNSWDLVLVPIPYVITMRR